MPFPLNPADVIQEQIDNLSMALPKADGITARDWQGFFNALAQFFSAILPLLIPLLAKESDEP